MGPFAHLRRQHNRGTQGIAPVLGESVGSITGLAEEVQDVVLGYSKSVSGNQNP